MISESRGPEILLEPEEGAGETVNEVEQVDSVTEVSKPRHPSTFEYGDNVFDFLKAPEIPVVPLGSDSKAAMLSVDRVSKETNNAYLSYLDGCNEVIARQFLATMDLAKLKKERMYAKYSKPIPLVIPSSVPSTPVGEPSNLPAGFGKRRGSGASMGGSKKSKTPS